ncbi:MAG: hypothetical protein AAB434_03480 [Planctomycetota bacterium]
MFRRLIGFTALVAFAVVGLSACSSEPCHHPPPPSCPIESAWVCPVDGSISCEPSLCPHCGAVRMQRSTGEQCSTETGYHVK